MTKIRDRYKVNIDFHCNTEYVLKDDPCKKDTTYRG